MQGKTPVRAGVFLVSTKSLDAIILEMDSFICYCDFLGED